VERSARLDASRIAVEGDERGPRTYELFFYFREKDLATRVGNALGHAITLSGGKKKEAF
jgi:hypothetical protein